MGLAAAMKPTFTFLTTLLLASLAGRPLAVFQWRHAGVATEDVGEILAGRKPDVQGNVRYRARSFGELLSRMFDALAQKVVVGREARVFFEHFEHPCAAQAEVSRQVRHLNGLGKSPFEIVARFGCNGRGVGAGRRGELAQGFDDGETRKGAKIGFSEGIAVVRFEGFGVLHQSRQDSRQFTIERAQGKRVFAEFPIHAAQFFARENRVHPRAVPAWLKKNTAKN